ncbi:MAG: hypothetical protein IJ587_04370 [Synergistaceae bacterium]|nr:hypothetical protein [Synergistaceae bacterium]
MYMEKVRISDYITPCGMVDIPEGYELVIPHWEAYDGYLVPIQNARLFDRANTPPVGKLKQPQPATARGAQNPSIRFPRKD